MVSKLLKFKEFSKFLNESTQPLLEGGAYGHLNHPFDDLGLTFLDLEELLMTTVNGAFGPENFVSEKCLSPDSIIQLKENGKKTIKEIVDHRISDMALSFNEITNEIEYSEILNWVKNESSNEWLEIELEDGKKIMVTPNHRIFVKGFGDTRAENLNVGDLLVGCG